MVIGDGSPVQVPLPALFINPPAQIVRPVYPLRMYASGDGKVNRVQLKDGNTGELVSIRIKKLIIVNVVILAKDPLAIRPKISLRRLAFDLVVQRLLPFVGMWQIELVSEEKSDCEQARGHHNRGNNAIDARAGSFHRRNLIAALH